MLRSSFVSSSSSSARRCHPTSWCRIPHCLSTSTSTTIAAVAAAATRRNTQHQRWLGASSSSSSSAAAAAGIGVADRAGGRHTHQLRLLPEVQDALAQQRPIVALESTILAHGLPSPANRILSHDVSRLIRAGGAIPATIAIHPDGYACIGLTADELDQLCQTNHSSSNKNTNTNTALKCTTRELPFHMAQQRLRSRSTSTGSTTEESDRTSPSPPEGVWGATTVASTMALAAHVGITTFVTGGTGGVHRTLPGETAPSLDISADLYELARTPVIVVSAGIKSILDLPATLEVLETYGVPVAAYQTEVMPAFFSPTSAVPAPFRVDSPEEVAEAFYISRQELHLPSGMLIAVPNPAPAAGAVIENAIQDALAELHTVPGGLRGKAVTPFLLQRVAETTQQASLHSNMILVKHNATVGAAIAVAVAARDAAAAADRGGGGAALKTTRTRHSNNNIINTNNTKETEHKTEEIQYKTALQSWKEQVVTSARNRTTPLLPSPPAAPTSSSSLPQQQQQSQQLPQQQKSVPVSSLASFGTKQLPKRDRANRRKVVVMGGSVIDIVARPMTRRTAPEKEDDEDIEDEKVDDDETSSAEVGQKKQKKRRTTPSSSLLCGTSNPGSCSEWDGGVGRNIAETLSRLGIPPLFYTAIGNDARGTALRQRLQKEYQIRTIDNLRTNDDNDNDEYNVNDTDGTVATPNTATYLAVLDSEGELHTAIADMDVLEDIPIPDIKTLRDADYLIVDANPPIQSLIQAAQMAAIECTTTPTKVCFEPTSVPKAARISQCEHFMSTISYAFPNLDELFAMARQDDDTYGDGHQSCYQFNANDIRAAATEVLYRCHPIEAHLIITMGPEGVLLASKYATSSQILFQHFEVAASSTSSLSPDTVNCTGAGDTLTGTFIAALLQGSNEKEAVTIGMEAAVLSLACQDRTISPLLSSFVVTTT